MTFDDDPERIITEGSFETLFQMISDQSVWTERALMITELAIYHWAAMLIKNQNRDALREFHALIQRIQVIRPQSTNQR